MNMKKTGEKITALTGYDFLIARLLDQVGIDIILVGDSLGNVVQGHETTLPVTVDDMIYHAKAVKRAVKNALIVVDMPFMSYQTSVDDAVRNCGRVMKEVGVGAVKLEGGAHIAEIVRHLVRIGIPVMGHLGLTPQAINKFGTYEVRATDEVEAAELIADAKTLAEAGAFSIVLEKIPSELARRVTAEVPVPTIGIGAGAGCDGQVLVVYDMLGLTEEFKPRFVRRYGEVVNTDAEGRLILADALHYAKKYKPELVLDLATLTGAAVRALGIQAVCYMGTAPQSVKTALEASGWSTYERLVELPLWKEYGDELKSNIADLRNVGAGNAGMITAGKFLQHFAGDLPWLHLDIAGPAYLRHANGYRTKEGTGVGVRLLYDFLKKYAASKKDTLS